MSWLSEKKIPASVVPWLLIVLSVVFAGVWYRYARSRPTIDSNAPAVQAQEAKKTANLPRTKILTSVAVVDKAEVERKIPGAISLETRTNPQKFTFPPAELGPWDGKRIVTPVLDNVTGEVHVEDKRLPPPFFQIKKEFQADGRYLFVGDHTAEIDAKVIPIRINARDGGVTIDPYLFGGVDFRRSDSSIGGRAGVGIQVRF